jgi:hypothetical protein
MIGMKPSKEDTSRIFSAVGKIKADLSNNVDDKVVGVAAKDFVTELRKNITEQTFGNFGVPLSEKWAKQKAKEGKGAGMFWLYLGILFKNIQANRIAPGRWWVGIQAAAGRANPKEYGQILERDRPLFERTFDMFKEKWNTNAQLMFQKIKGDWS